MTPLGEFFSELQGNILLFARLDKAAIKATIIAAGGENAWQAVTLLTHPYVILLGVLPCLLLERFLPARDYRAHKSGSLLLDYLYPIFNLFLTSAFIGYGTLLAMYFYKTYLPGLNTGLLDGKPFWIQALGAFLITDLALYWSHRLRHQIRWLWHFHAIHHSQRHLNPATTYRSHFGEKIISPFITTIPIAFVGGEYPAWLLFSLLNNFWGHFIHANLKVNLGWVGKFIVSPQFHRVHHSDRPEHFDMNYGERLVVWDWIFGSYHGDRGVYPTTGIANAKWIHEESNHPIKLCRAYLMQLIYPFAMVCLSLYRHGKAIYGRLRTGKAYIVR